MAEQARLKTLLGTGRLSFEKVMRGSAGAELFSCEGAEGERVRVLVKRPRDERSEVMSKIPPGTWTLREVAAYELSERTGLGMVPPTVLRIIDGEACSVQLFIEDSDRPEPTSLLRRDFAERMRAFDYVLGNTDRARGNLLGMKAGKRPIPVLIDHGFSLPEGPPRNMGCDDPRTASHTGPLLPATQAWIASLEADVLLDTLVRYDFPREVLVHALRRLEALKQDPSIIQVPAWSRLEQSPARGRPVKWYALWERCSEFVRREEQGLSASVLTRIDAQVDDALARTARPRLYCRHDERPR